MIIKTMVVIFNLQNSHLMTLSLPAEDVFRYMVHTGLTTFYSRTFPGLFKDFKTIFKEFVSTGMISHFFDSHPKKAIPVSVNDVIQPKERIVYRA